MSGSSARFRMRPGGLEPPTHSLEGCCSIQLSYGRVRFKAYPTAAAPGSLGVGPGIFSAMAESLTHKATAECGITGPHDPALCGIVQARRRRSAAMQEAIERQLADEEARARSERPKS